MSKPLPPERAIENSLRATRARLGLSQQELAAAAGITRQTVAGIEAGQYSPSAGVALRLARALGCRVEDLFWLPDEAPRLEARVAPEMREEVPTRVSLGQVEGRWVAHPLRGDDAFRTEMVPADGIALRDAGQETAAVDLLDDPSALGRSVLLAGCTPALSLWARAAERWHSGLRVHWTFANSMQALQRLRRGEVHAAGLHLRDPDTGEHNVPFVRRELQNARVVLVNLGTWEEGLAVNPARRLAGVQDLESGARLVNREPGSGARLLLEQTLSAARIPEASVRGWDYVARGHVEVARAVAAGDADAGVTTAAVSAAYGLEFLPLTSVRYDLALRRESLDHEPVRQLLGTLDHRWVRSQLNLLVGYDTSRTGEVVAEVGG